MGIMVNDNAMRYFVMTTYKSMLYEANNIMSPFKDIILANQSSTRFFPCCFFLSSRISQPLTSGRQQIKVKCWSDRKYH